jgi:Metallo-peptidase family M12B Reprolysin-like
MVNCIGLSGTVSIVRDFYGYVKAPYPLSLTQQVRLLKGNYLDINIIRVGVESFTIGDEKEIDSAVHLMRKMYATVGIGVGRVARYGIATADAGGKDFIDDRDEAEELTEEWTVDNSAIDVFVVRNYAGNASGSSPVEGPCNKDSKTMSGVVVSIEGDVHESGIVLAHEVGHYLGLEHNPDLRNLMYETADSLGRLTPGQGGVMRLHCKMRDGCGS